MKNKTPKIIVMSGYGLNCEEETKYAFQWAGGRADIVHINDLIKDKKTLNKYDILAFPGGFSYGDDTGSGKAFANKFKSHLQKELDKFLSRDTLVIGICNGFQIITALGIVPGALTHNKSAKYIDRWVDLEIRGRSPWLKGIKKISLPIAHGEGRYVIDDKEYKNMVKNNQVAFTYTKGEMCKYQNMEMNPNGAMHDIAGVLSANGKVLGLMPHPERGMFFHHRPDFYLQKEILKRKNKKLPEMADGIILFQNSIKYFKK